MPSCFARDALIGIGTVIMQPLSQTAESIVNFVINFDPFAPQFLAAAVATLAWDANFVDTVLAGGQLDRCNPIREILPIVLQWDE